MTIKKINTAIYWFRNDLRLSDNPAFTLACKNTDLLLPIYINLINPAINSEPSYPQISKQRINFLHESLNDLNKRLKGLGSRLVYLAGDYLKIFQALRDELGTNLIYCEQIEAAEELKQVAQLIDSGFDVKFIWQSSMLDPQSLPFELELMPSVFTQFRLRVEKHKLKFTEPLNTPQTLPALPACEAILKQSINLDTVASDKPFYGGESKATAHVEQYFARRLVDSYKKTRNQLIGMDYSSKFSLWLALGCCSARSIAKKLLDYEHEFGANEGTYWLWFELLWRDYFRFLNLGKVVKNPQNHFSDFPSEGLGEDFRSIKFKRWSNGYTGQSFVDAGMRELLSNGYLSNRMRQIVASYWIYDLNGNWRVGEAWFRSQLLDYDVYSNQGNWQYISGAGIDHQGGRRFNITKQEQEHDPNGVYQKIWLD